MSSTLRLEPDAQLVPPIFKRQKVLDLRLRQHCHVHPVDPLDKHPRLQTLLRRLSPRLRRRQIALVDAFPAVVAELELEAQPVVLGHLDVHVHARLLDLRRALGHDVHGVAEAAVVAAVAVAVHVGRIRLRPATVVTAATAASIIPAVVVHVVASVVVHVHVVASVVVPAALVAVAVAHVVVTATPVVVHVAAALVHVGAHVPAHVVVHCAVVVPIVVHVPASSSTEVPSEVVAAVVVHVAAHISLVHVVHVASVVELVVVELVISHSLASIIITSAHVVVELVAAAHVVVAHVHVHVHVHVSAEMVSGVAVVVAELDLALVVVHPVIVEVAFPVVHVHTHIAIPTTTSIIPTTAVISISISSSTSTSTSHPRNTFQLHARALNQSHHHLLALPLRDDALRDALTTAAPAPGAEARPCRRLARRRRRCC